MLRAYFSDTTFVRSMAQGSEGYIAQTSKDLLYNCLGGWLFYCSLPHQWEMDSSNRCRHFFQPMLTLKLDNSIFTWWKTRTSKGCKMWIVWGGNPNISFLNTDTIPIYPCKLNHFCLVFRCHEWMSFRYNWLLVSHPHQTTRLLLALRLQLRLEMIN